MSYSCHINIVSSIILAVRSLKCKPYHSENTKKRKSQSSGFPLFYLGIYPQNHTLYISFIRSYFLCHFWQPKPTWLSPRPISDSQLHMLPCFHLCPIYLVVFKGSYSCDGISHLEGGFTLRCLQRLSLPDLATRPWVWYPTGTPEVSPSRSSRTKDSSSQISYAHAG